MARIAYLLLCHKDPEGVIAQARRLTAAGDSVTIHFDGRAPDAAFRRIREELQGDPLVAFAGRRIRCGWGEWSLVQATLETLRSAAAGFPDASHFYMLSGDCMPIKSAAYAHALLDAEAADYIESVDYFASGWIKTGMREERLIYRHYLNERRHKRLFYAALELQKRLGLQRRWPSDLDIMIGSQWWCLRRGTVQAILDFLAQRPDVIRFFRTTWIPDETFFQTLVRHLVPGDEIRSRTLTFLMFTDYGMPVTFHDDHYDLLLAQGYLFARKIAPGAVGLQDRLGRLYASGRTDFTITDEGRALYAFLAGRGRIGQRFAPRFWEAGASLTQDSELLILACKDWVRGRALARAIAGIARVPAVGYLFTEDDAGLPDLGGIERSLTKRTRHRRAVLRLLFESFDTRRLVICIDPGQFDLVEDFAGDRGSVRMLEVQIELDQAFLDRHARNVGLASAATPQDRLDEICRTLRGAIEAEGARLRRNGRVPAASVRAGTPPERNAAALAAFLGVSQDIALRLAADPALAFGGLLPVEPPSDPQDHGASPP